MAQNNGNNGPPNLQFDEDMCERYLLGELSGADQERFEAAYFGDDVFFDRFMAVKTELLDLYARGELEQEKQERMRHHFAATAPRRKHLAESEQFIDAVTNLSANSGKKADAIAQDVRPFFSFLKMPVLVWASAAVFLFIGLGIWWSSSTQPQETDIAASQPSPARDVSRDIPVPAPSITNEKKEFGGETGSIDKPAGSTPVNKPQVADVPRKAARSQSVPKSSGLPARLVLSAVTTRDISDANTLRIYEDTPRVSIELSPPGGSHKRYTADITTISGESHWQTKQERGPIGKKLTLQVDPRALKQSDYILTLRGRTPGGGSEVVSEYYFHVVREAQAQGPPLVAPPK